MRNDVGTSHITTDSPPSLLSHHRTSATKWFLAQFDRRPKVCSEAGWPEPFRGALMEPELHHSVCWHFAFPAPLLNLVIAQFRGSRFLHYAHQPGWRCFAGLAPGGAGGSPLLRATSCRLHMCKLLQLPPAAPDTPPASCGSHNHHKLHPPQTSRIFRSSRPTISRILLFMPQRSLIAAL